MDKQEAIELLRNTFPIGSRVFTRTFHKSGSTYGVTVLAVRQTIDGPVPDDVTYFVWQALDLSERAYLDTLHAIRVQTAGAAAESVLVNQLSRALYGETGKLTYSRF